jgi:hypothetical protein
MAELNRPGVGQADDRGRMKTHADRKAFGEVLMGRLAGDDRWGVAGFGSRSEAQVPGEVFLELGGIGRNRG